MSEEDLFYALDSMFNQRHEIDTHVPLNIALAIAKGKIAEKQYAQHFSRCKVCREGLEQLRKRGTNRSDSL